MGDLTENLLVIIFAITSNKVFENILLNFFVEKLFVFLLRDIQQLRGQNFAIFDPLPFVWTVFIVP